MYLLYFCSLCLNNNKNLKSILVEDKDGIVVDLKLKYIISEIIDIKPEIPKYICSICLKQLNSFYKFKQKCLQNNITLNDYYRNLAITDEAFKNLSTSFANLEHQNLVQAANNFPLFTNNVMGNSVPVTENTLNLQNQQDAENQFNIQNQPNLLDQHNIEQNQSNLQNQCNTQFQHNLQNQDYLKNQPNLLNIENLQTLHYLKNQPNQQIQNNVKNKEIEVRKTPTLPKVQNQINCNSLNNENSQSSSVEENLEENPLEDIEVKEERVDEDETASRRYFEFVKCETDPEASGENSASNGSSYQPEENKTNEQYKPKKKRITGRIWKCAICAKEFVYQNSLKYHLKAHADIKNYECKICAKKFRSKSHLESHHKSHSGIKEHQCEFCDKSFLYKCSLMSHLKNHEGIKNHECRFCQKKFMQKVHLTQHEKIHSGIRDFECPICHKKFTCKGHMVRHKKIHTNFKKFLPFDNMQIKTENVENTMMQ